MAALSIQSLQRLASTACRRHKYSTTGYLLDVVIHPTIFLETTLPIATLKRASDDGGGV